MFPLLPIRLLVLCALATAVDEGQQAWALEALVVHGDHEHTSDPGLTSAIEEGVHENLETLATLELTLHGLGQDQTDGGAPDAAARQREAIAAMHRRIGQVNEVLKSLQGYLVQLNSQMNATTETLVNASQAAGQCHVNTHFPCSNGICLSYKKRCDGTVDCPGGGDELFCGLTAGLCGAKQWECLEGNQCISTYWRCDGDVDCADGSDEIDCGVHRCAINEFECTTGQCIPRNWRCDGDDDCKDSSDERGCVKAECSDAYFKCSSGDKCVHTFWRCDGESDCFDGSDEADCHDIIKPCTSKEFECASHHECVPKEKVCDGAADCHDLSDENACPARPSDGFLFVSKPAPEKPNDQKKATYVNSTSECEGRFLCATGGLCIPSEWHCDRDDDCPDSSDEVGCVQAVCRMNYFGCTSGDKCIHSRWRCDGDYDCFDKSDEAGCTDTHIECGPSHFKCKLHGECVAPSKVCDGVPDCKDASDEARCATSPTEAAATPSTSPATAGLAHNVSKDTSKKAACGPLGSQCQSGQCIPRGWLCDGEIDCLDGSDEFHCPKINCGNNTLICAAEGKCFPLELKCDGVRDCSDGSDEEGCLKRACKKVGSGKEFTCQDTGRCLPMSWRCDGQQDCLDGGDEVGCPKSQIKKCDLQRGQFACQSGSQCLSFKKVCDGRKDCVDGSDEGGVCEDPCPATACSDGCFRTPSGPQCTCPANTTLDNRGTSCISGLPSPFLLVGQRDAVEAYALDGLWNLTVYEGKSTHSGVISVAYDPVEDEVYFSIVERAGIYKVDLLKTQSPQFIFDSDESVVEAMDIDYLGRNLYIMDGMRQVLLACSLSGFVCTTVLKNTTSSPRSLQLDLENRKMFWTDWKAGVVESSDMDGSGQSTLVSNLFWPNALAIDPKHQRVYWMEASTATLESVKYDGTDRRLISNGTVQHVYAMDLWASWLYFTDWSTSVVYRCNWNNCSEKTPITDPLPGRPFGIHVVHIQLLEVSNPCQNNMCSHICLLSATSGKGYRCACSTREVLQKDYHTCAAPNLVEQVHKTSFSVK